MGDGINVYAQWQYGCDCPVCGVPVDSISHEPAYEPVNYLDNLTAVLPDSLWHTMSPCGHKVSEYTIYRKKG